MKRFFMAALAMGLLLSSCNKNGDDVLDYQKNEQDQEQNQNQNSPVDYEPAPQPQGKKDHYGNPLQMPAMPKKVDGLPAKQGKLPNYHQEGKWLVDESGRHVVMHGCYQTQVPWMTGNAYDSRYPRAPKRTTARSWIRPTSPLSDSGAMVARTS